MKIRPLNNRVLVQRAERETQTAGGIYIPETANMDEAVCRAEVLAVGDGDDVRAAGLAAGQVVLVRQYGGTDIPGLDGQAIYRSEDILAVIGVA